MATWLGTVYSYFQALRFCQTDNRLNRVFYVQIYSQKLRQKLKTNPRNERESALVFRRS